MAQFAKKTRAGWKEVMDAGLNNAVAQFAKKTRAGWQEVTDAGLNNADTTNVIIKRMITLNNALSHGHTPSISYSCVLKH